MTPLAVVAPAPLDLPQGLPRARVRPLLVRLAPGATPHPRQALEALSPSTGQPMQRAFESIPPDIREAASCCGMSRWHALLRVELPLAWPGILTAMVLSFAHTLGEFGIVLMVGGSIPGETRTIAISIYDRVQAFDDLGAAQMSAFLLAVSLVTIALTFAFSRRIGRRIG